MAGRWFITAPNAPPCGVMFTGGPGATSGGIAPDGGCPGRFYLSRRWSRDGDMLTISDEDNEPLER